MDILNKIIEDASLKLKEGSKLITDEYPMDIASCWGIYDWLDDPHNRLKAAMSAVNQCVDTWVGLRVIFLDDKPVAIKHQLYRKSDKEYYFISPETEALVKSYIYSLVESEEFKQSYISDFNIDSMYYNLTYTDQLIHKFGYILENEEYIEVNVDDGNQGYLSREIRVFNVDKNIDKIINTSELFLKYNQEFKL